MQGKRCSKIWSKPLFRFSFVRKTKLQTYETDPTRHRPSAAAPEGSDGGEGSRSGKEKATQGRLQVNDARFRL